MYVICDDCGHEYDDVYRLTFCPHEQFEMHCLVSRPGHQTVLCTTVEQVRALLDRWDRGSRREVRDVEVKVGDQIVYVDKTGAPRPALVTAVWGKETYPYEDGTGPTINLVYVSEDATRQDPYGRQIERETSIVHASRQSAPGNYWRGWDELYERPHAAPRSEVHT